MKKEEKLTNSNNAWQNEARTVTVNDEMGNEKWAVTLLPFLFLLYLYEL